MIYTVSISYSTDAPEVNGSILQLLENTLPYMVDNVSVIMHNEEGQRV